MAESFLERLVGIKSRQASQGVLLRTRSIHSFGLGESIGVFVADRDWTVLLARKMPPNRVALFRSGKYVVELPPRRELPAVGAIVNCDE